MTTKDLFTVYSQLGAFVETGTCDGRAVQEALDCGFKTARSVEGAPHRYFNCLERFRGNCRVKLWCGKSPVVLPDMIRDLSQPAMFWLDAHPSGEGSYGWRPNNAEEQQIRDIVTAEIGVISRHPVNGHVILVDDMKAEDIAWLEKLLTCVMRIPYSVDLIFTPDRPGTSVAICAPRI